MKYSEAIKVAMCNADFARSIDNFKRNVAESHVAGSIQFAIGDEAFFYAGEAVYDEATGNFEYKFKGGKHTARRAAYLINRGQTFIVA